MPAKRTLDHSTSDARKAARTRPERKSASPNSEHQITDAYQSQASIQRFGACALADRSHGAGQIKSVHVTNFMCHTNMKVDFEPHVNFISGPNGSGKSAILQALQYCLGVRATQTGRGTSNAAYLKRGADQSTAQVTIWNTGLDGDAFHPETFGNHITIQKTLSAKGHTSTKVLDARGHKTTLTKADDIRRLLSHLSVNAANPSIVLTQDHARGLLSGDKVDTKLYDLMFESLEFERTIDNLSRAREEIRNQSEEVDNFKQAKEEFEQKLGALQERLELATMAEAMRDAGDQVEDYMAWAIVKFLDGKLQEIDDGMKDSGPAARDQLQEQMAAADQELKQLEEQEQELVAVMQETERRTAAHTQERDVMRKRKRDAMAKKNRVTKLVEQCKSHFEEVEEKRMQADRYVQELRARGDGNDAVAKKLEQWRERRDTMVQSMDQSQAGQHDAMKALKSAMDTVNNLKDQSTSIRQEYSRQKGQIEALQRQLQSMERSSGPNQQASMFDSNAPTILNAIEKNINRFKCRPIGPLGAHLSLMDDRYSATVVGALSKLLPSWVVDNRDDFRTLVALVKQAKLRNEPSIFIMRFDVPLYNIPPHQMPHESILTIYRALKVKPETLNGHVVFNILVDHGRIESVGLVESEAIGRKLLEDGNSWRNLSNLWCKSDEGPVDMKRTAGGAKSIWPWPGHKPLPSPLLTAVRF